MTPEDMDAAMMPLVVKNIEEEYGTILFMPVWTEFLEKYNAMLKTETECEWTPEDDEYWSYWDTACGQAFSFEADGPTENKFKFCCFCGGTLVQTTND